MTAASVFEAERKRLTGVPVEHRGPNVMGGGWVMDPTGPDHHTYLNSASEPLR